MDDVTLGPVLLWYLRGETSAPDLSFASEPVRIMGGRDTRIYGLSLTGTPEAWTEPLILRIFRAEDGADRALRESVVQSTVWSLDFPAPRVVHTCTSANVLGSAFIVMEHLPGRDLISERGIFGLAPTLVELHARLHALDAAVLQTAMDAAGLPPFDPIGDLRQRLDAHSLDSLRPGLQWLVEHTPAPTAHVICHGDFHPENVLMHEKNVTGVIDWDLTTVAAAEYDVGNTRALLRLAEPAFGGVMARVVRTLQPLLAWGYIRRYTARRPLGRDAVRYWEAYRCLRSLAVTLSGRWAGDEGAGPPPWNASRVARHFERITGTKV